MKSPELQKKAQMLLSSDLFLSNIENCPLLEKQNIFLVLSGLKPVSFVTSNHLSGDPHMAQESHGDDPSFVSSFLLSLGLYSKLFTDKYSTDAIVSLNQKFIDEVESHMDDPIHCGILYGYPKTAIQAFVSEDKSLRLTEEEQEKTMRDNGIPECFPHFIMSKKYFTEEIKIIKSWFDICREYGMV